MFRYHSLPILPIMPEPRSIVNEPGSVVNGSEPLLCDNCKELLSPVFGNERLPCSKCNSQMEIVVNDPPPPPPAELDNNESDVNWNNVVVPQLVENFIGSFDLSEIVTRQLPATLEQHFSLVEVADTEEYSNSADQTNRLFNSPMNIEWFNREIAGIRILQERQGRLPNGILNGVDQVIVDSDDDDDEVMPLWVNHDSHTLAMPLEKLNNLPSTKIRQDQVEQQLQCSICRENFKLNEETHQLECDHVFHSECIVPWLRRRGSCPNCRRDFTQTEHSSESFTPALDSLSNSDSAESEDEP